MTKNKDKKNNNKHELKLKIKKSKKDDEKREEGSKLKNLVDSYMEKEGSYSLKQLKDKYKKNNRDKNKNKEKKEKRNEEKVKLKDNKDKKDMDMEELDEETQEYKEDRVRDADEYNGEEEKDDKNSVVFIGNVPLTIQKRSDLVKKLQLDPKIIQSVHFRSLPIHPKYASNKKIGVMKKKFSDVKDSQNAYVKLTDSKYLDQLLEKNTMEVDGHHLFINPNNSDSFSKFSRKKTVFVGRLPPSTNEDELYNIFMNVSPVKGVRIVRDPKTMKSKGFGFVAFDNRLAVSQAIKEFNNTEFKGYTLNVSKCLDEKSSREANKDFRKRRVGGYNNNKSNLSKSKKTSFKTKTKTETNFKKKKFH